MIFNPVLYIIKTICRMFAKIQSNLNNVRQMQTNADCHETYEDIKSAAKA